MENFEGWDSHPTKPNIYIDQGTGLLYRRTPGGSFRRIQQRMTECQQLEIFTRASGFVGMTSRSWGRTNPPADSAPDASHT
jgi:hypothetical protein